jgi:UDP-N-acetylglucosamine--N-acetylmuramyl-(pentapeptide) pyrophosphoryl-undecaprenol N-acetylglucosamine transferase
MPRIALIGGYTAGHVFPMLAVAEAYRARNAGAEILFVGGRGSFEATVIRERGYVCHEVAGAPLFGIETRRERLRSRLKVAQGFWQARRLFARAEVELALGFGGYITAGPMLAARSLGMATAVFEANVIPGRANRAVQRWMDHRFLGFAETAAYPGWRASKVVGYPLRPEIANLAGSARAPPQGRDIHVIVTGGSRGSEFLNRACPGLLGQVAARGIGISVRHQTGLGDIAAVARAYRGLGLSVTVEAFADDMASVYRWADFAICAAGAGTLAELSAIGLPAFLVPTADVADDHQRANAQAYANRAAAPWVREAEWDERSIADSLAQLLREPDALRAAAARTSDAARLDAAAEIVAGCERLLAERRTGSKSASIKAAPRRSAKP